MIHIDFGFMLSNSPGGNVNFEQSPFKLTQDLISTHMPCWVVRVVVRGISDIAPEW